MGNSQDICLGRDSKGPQRFAEISPEEAYMLKKQQDLKLFVLTCEDLEKAFEPYLHFGSINEKEFIEVLIRLHLIREDNPDDTLVWNNFYSKFKIDATIKGVLKPHFEIKAIMIALYFLTSSKASVKARYIGQLYHDYKTSYDDEFNEDKSAQIPTVKIES